MKQDYFPVMNNNLPTAAPSGCAGCDVSKDWLDVCKKQDGETTIKRFDNTTAGHQKLCKWLGSRPIRVTVEASGIYSVDLALALHNYCSTAVMVVHPRALKDYRRAHLQRSKTGPGTIKSKNS